MPTSKFLSGFSHVYSLMRIIDEKMDHKVLKQHPKFLIHQNINPDDYMITIENYSFLLTDPTSPATSISFNFELLPLAAVKATSNNNQTPT